MVSTLPADQGHTMTPKQKWYRSNALKENLVSYTFLLPWLIGFFVFTVGPILASLYLSFTNYDLMTSPEFVGTFNYARLLERDHRFLKSLAVTFTYVFTSVPLQLLVALCIALVLNRGISAYVSQLMREKKKRKM